MELKNISSLLDNKLAQFELVHSITLFEPDMRIATKQCRCPYCGRKLVLMRNKPFYHCVGTKHRNKFIISKDKVKQ